MRLLLLTLLVASCGAFPARVAFKFPFHVPPRAQPAEVYDTHIVQVETAQAAIDLKTQLLGEGCAVRPTDNDLLVVIASCPTTSVTRTVTRDTIVASAGVAAHKFDDYMSVLPPQADEVNASSLDLGNPTTASADFWNLDRMNEKFRTYDGQKQSFACYPAKGQGVRVYILDTGLRTSHTEFASALVQTKSVDNSNNGINDGSDGSGHGTHVAGIIVGRNTGVAPAADVRMIRVLNSGGSGTWSDIIAGIGEVIAAKKANPATPMVMSLSIGGGFYSLVNNAIARARALGVFPVVAAGNNNADACLYSPSSATGAFSVASATSGDQYSSFSNFGSCTNMIGPGSNILSASYSSDYGYVTMSGTSMAAPHVTGAIALVLSQDPTLTPAELLAQQRINGLSPVPSASKGSTLVPLVFVDEMRGGACALPATTTEAPVTTGAAHTHGRPPTVVWYALWVLAAVVVLLQLSARA